jgi:hypothetical protein
MWLLHHILPPKNCDDNTQAIARSSTIVSGQPSARVHHYHQAPGGPEISSIEPTCFELPQAKTIQLTTQRCQKNNQNQPG